MKKEKWFYKTITILLLTLLTFTDTAAAGNVMSGTNGNGRLTGMKMAAENDCLELYIDEETTCIAVKEKKSSEVWMSNPPERDMDTLASGVNKDRLGSQLSIQYFDSSNHEIPMNNFSDSIKKKQFEIEYGKDGVKIIYTLGNVSESYILPRSLGEARMNEILSKIADESDKSKLLKVYTKLSITATMSDKDKKDLENKYPGIGKSSIYELRNTKNKSMLGTANEVLKSTGYNEADMEKDLSHYGVQSEGSPDIFKMVLYYRLDGKYLDVDVPVKEMEYDERLQLTKIRVLEFFGAAGTGDTGYIFVPDGSGSLIYLNNGKSYEPPYITRIYGRDLSIKTEQMINRNETAYLPVYGIKNGDTAFFAVVDGFDSNADIIADVAGRINSYNYVCPEFTVTPYDSVKLGNLGTGSVNVFQEKKSDTGISVRYAFLNGDDADYAGMAREYREYLEKYKGLKRMQAGSSVPFYIELLGGIDRTKFFLGIPYKGYQSLTTYDQSVKIIEMLREKGIDNIVFRYTGWSLNGIRHSLPGNVDFQRQLGGRKGFEKLEDYVRSAGIKLYPDLCFNYLQRTSFFDEINITRDTARFLSRETAEVYSYDKANFLENKRYSPLYILTSKFMEGVVTSFLKNSGRMEVDGFSLRKMGTDLNSDFNEKRLKDREMAMNDVISTVKAFKESDSGVMLEGANAYALPYADYILNTPTDSNMYNITDESIPFYQLALRGYAGLAGTPLNMSFNIKRQMLKTVETGGGVYYTWIYARNSLLKDTEYDGYFSVNYSAWISQAADFYKKVNDALGDVEGQTIKDHERLSPNVYKVTFEKGKSILVNYNFYPMEIDNTVVMPEDFAVVQ